MTVDLAAIKARADAATPGPWVTETPEAIHGDPANFAGMLYVSTADAVADDDPPYIGPIEPADADFIAHAREDVPALLAEVEGWRQAAETYKASRDASDQRVDEARAEVARLRAQVAAVTALCDAADIGFQRDIGVVATWEIRAALAEHTEETR